MTKRILFTDGILSARYDSDIHGDDIPSEAITVSDEMFFKTINENDGVWSLVDNQIVKVPLPEPTLNDIRAQVEVTSFQAHAAIARAGLYDAVDSLMNNPETPIETRLAWQKAQTFKRLSPTVLSMGFALGLDDEALDNLFTLAATIDA